jgi:alkaline phosphatase D
MSYFHATDEAPAPGALGCGSRCACVHPIGERQMGQARFAEAGPAPPTLAVRVTPPVRGLHGPIVPSQNVLAQARLKTTTVIDGRTALLIQSVLEQSRVLNPFISAKLKTLPVARSFVLHGSDAEFNSAYLRLSKTVVPFGSKEEKELLGIRGFYHRPTDSIHVRPTATVGLALQLAIHKLSVPAFRQFFGTAMDEGLSLYLANLVLGEQGLAAAVPEQYRDQLHCAADLADVAGVTRVARAYFENHLDLLRHLTTNLTLGPVRPAELSGDALCKTPLLRTARFARQTVKNMVAVGITGPRWVRLWMRAEQPGTYELQILGDPNTTRPINIAIPPGNRRDNTVAVTYPPTSDHRPLDPGRRYGYRFVRMSDRALMGGGSFQTAPADDPHTPQKVVIAVMSCHQPFTDQGTITPEATRMLRLLPRILKENDVRFVLPCGDQIYADEPGAFSLFTNPYLIRQTVPGKTSIFDCSAEEVRRLYDMRYRTFWHMSPIREMYANYPCYPILDDHEIENSWGTNPEHSSPRYRNILRGALDAYFDYQASRILPPTTRIPDSFHYHMTYGNIGVFVMDIRSERSAHSRNPMYSEVQLNDLRRFLGDNGHKKVLLIVASVPVVFVPGGLADIGARLKPTTFLDHWSHTRNIPARDALLGLLHAHQQAHPNQRVAILSGDVHIGNAFVIKWRGGNKPRLYQFTSSAITALESRTDHFLTSVAPRLVANIDCQTRSGGLCSGEVSHLPAAEGTRSHNPFVGLNLGLVEVQRFGDVSNLKFKLIGYHPKEERPVTYFESGWLS